jgi:hypothetical protein
MDGKVIYRDHKFSMQKYKNELIVFMKFYRLIIYRISNFWLRCHPEKCQAEFIEA